MHLHRADWGVVVHAPAKLNLFFEVLGKRPDGYHEIESLVTPIGLFDTLSFQPDDKEEIILTCQRVSAAWGAAGPWVEDLPTGPGNLVVRAVELLRQRAGVRKGARLHLIKRIPTAAGLGGGSSDAAAALMAASAGWQLDWPPSALQELGAEIGSDVPLFFARGPAVCRGRGEKVEPIPSLGTLHFVVVRPPVGLSTVAVYQACRPPERPEGMHRLMDCFRRGDLAAAGRAMLNRLEPAAETLTPWIARLRDAMRRVDCLGQQMSGSGSCYFGLCRHARHAQRVARRLQSLGIGTALAVRGVG